MALFFAFAGDAPPAINEAHYLVLAKNFWQPQWCAQDLFVTSNKPHVLYHATFGGLTQLMSLPAAAWTARLIGWLLIALGLRTLCRAVSDRNFACLLVAIIWIVGLEWFNLAGEWVIGGTEAKVPAYACVLAAMTLMARGRWWAVWPLLGLASAFHVLVGGWSVVAALVAYAVTGRLVARPTSQLVPLFLGGAIALIGVLPGLQMSVATSPGESLAAAKIYTYVRLSHHLVPATFPASWFLRHAALLTLTLLLAWPLRHHQRLRPLIVMMLACIGIAAAGLAVGSLHWLAPDAAARWLRLYWFRASDATTPLLLGLIVAAMLARAPAPAPAATGPTDARGNRRLSLRRWAPPASPAGWARAIAATATILLTISVVDRLRRDLPISAQFDVLRAGRIESYAAQRAAYRDWIDVCHWIDQTFAADEIFITPRHQQTFKWHAGRAEVVNWKDVPQDVPALLQWHQRFFDVYPRRLGTVRVTIRYDELRRMGQQYGARFLVVDRRLVGDNLPLPQVYPLLDPVDKVSDRPLINATYAVYRLPPANEPITAAQ